MPLSSRGVDIGPSGVRIEEHQSGNSVELSVKMPRNHWGGGNRSVKVELQVPRDLEASIKTGDGSVKASGLHGTLQATTGDGSVQIDNFDGKLETSTGDGSVSLNGRFDDLSVRTGDGPVSLNASAGSRIQSGWDLQTGDGPVQIRIPTNLKANLDMQTGDGPIKFDYLSAAKMDSNRNHVQAQLNGGGSRLHIQTGDGPISLGQS